MQCYLHPDENTRKIVHPSPNLTVLRQRWVSYPGCYRTTLTRVCLPWGLTTLSILLARGSAARKGLEDTQISSTKPQEAAVQCWPPSSLGATHLHAGFLGAPEVMWGSMGGSPCPRHMNCSLTLHFKLLSALQHLILKALLQPGQNSFSLTAQIVFLQKSNLTASPSPCPNLLYSYCKSSPAGLRSTGQS